MLTEKQHRAIARTLLSCGTDDLIEIITACREMAEADSELLEPRFRSQNVFAVAAFDAMATTVAKDAEVKMQKTGLKVVQLTADDLVLANALGELFSKFLRTHVLDDQPDSEE